MGKGNQYHLRHHRKSVGRYYSAKAKLYLPCRNGCSFSENGISSLQDLVRKLEAGSDYTNPDNALYQYVAYHILPGSYDLKKMRSFDTADVTSKIWDTSSTGNIVKVSNKNDIFYLNYADEEHRATFPRRLQ